MEKELTNTNSNESNKLDQIADSLQKIASSMNKDTRAELYHSETHCPSCGRFVGTETRCPYCQTETQKRLSIRIFKVISVLISTVGLLMLLFYAQGIKTPEAKITDLGPLTNFAHVRIVGFADKDATLSKWGTLSFNVIQFYDKNGELVTDREKIKNCEKKEIRVTAYKKVAELINDDQKPRKGEEVEVEGQVRVQQGEASLLINAPEHIRAIYDETKVRRPLQAGQPFNSQFKKPFKKLDSNIPYTKPEEINESLIKKNVKLIATVKTALKVENDCVIIRIENGKENGLAVFIPNFSKGNMAFPQAGNSVEIFGIVDNYTNNNITELEIKLSLPGHYIKMLKQN